MSSGSQSAGHQVVLRWHAKCVRHAVEEREHCNHVNGLRDLIFRPPRVTQFLYVRGSGFVSGFCNQLCIIKQRALRSRQTGLIELALQNRRDALIGGSLNTQEVGVAVESIRAPVQE